MSTMQADYNESMLLLLSRIGALKKQQEQQAPGTAKYAKLSRRIRSLEASLDDVTFQSNQAMQSYGWTPQ